MTMPTARKRLHHLLHPGVLWLAITLCAAAAGTPPAQVAPAGREQARDTAAFAEFSGRVTEYLKLQRAAESTMPTLAPTDRPELIAAHQQVLAKKIQAARARAKAGDIFSSSVREAFRHASRTALEGPNAQESLAYMQPGASAANLPLAVNAIYPEAGPVTSLSPALLASFPPLPESLAYRIVGRSLILVDVKAHLVVDIARLILSPPAGRAPAFAFPLDADSVRLAVIGDMGSGKRAQYQVAAQMMTSRTRFPFEFVITVGDNIYAGNTRADIEKAFSLPYKPLLDAGVLFYATLGNHDDTNQRFYKPFNMNGERYYTYTKRNVRFLALDSNYMDPAQLVWLEARLRDAGAADWTIVYLHHALYSSARYHGSAGDLRAVLEPLFVKYGVDVVFGGHDHVYERVHPQRGIYYFTEGASGQLRSGNLKPSAITAKGFDADRSFMLVEITGDDLYFQAVSRTGVSVDSGVIHRTIRPSPLDGRVVTVKPPQNLADTAGR